MAERVKDFREWLSSFDDEAQIWIGPDGLTINVRPPGVGGRFDPDYYELGGRPIVGPVVIDWPEYGAYNEFGDIDGAQDAIRQCGPEFAGVTLTRDGANIRNERGEIVGTYDEGDDA